MVPMKALAGFSDRALATEHNPSGAVAAGSPFEAPSETVAKQLESTGQAERAKAPPSAPKA